MAAEERARRGVRGLLREGFRSVRAAGWRLAAVVLASQLLMLFVVSPALGWLFKEALRAGGMHGLDLGGLAGLPLGGGVTITVLLLVAIVVIAFWLIAVQFTAFVVLVRRPGAPTRDLLRMLGTTLRRLLRPGAIPLVLYLFLLIPLSGFGFVSVLTQGIAIPSFISGELLKSPSTTIGLIVFLLILAVLNVRFSLTVPAFVLTDTRRPVRASRRLTRGLRWVAPTVAALAVLVLGSVAGAALTLVALGPTWLADVIAPAAAPVVAAYSLGIAQIAGMLLAGYTTAIVAAVLSAAVEDRADELPGGAVLLDGEARVDGGAGGRSGAGSASGSLAVAAGTEVAGSGAPGTEVAGSGVAGTGAAGTGVAGTGAAGTGAAGAGAAGTGAAGTGDAGSGVAGSPRRDRRAGAAVIGVAVVAALVIGTVSIGTLRSLSEAPQTLVLGHRGFSDGGVENTISGLEAAAEAGADLVEMDVMQTKDGEFVAMHDPMLQRLAGRPDAVKDLTLDELTAITVRDRAGHEDVIPTFAAYVERAKELGMPLLIEIKMGGADTPDHVARLIAELEELDALERNIYHSLDAPSVAELKRLRPDLTVGYTMAFAGAEAPETPADFIVVEEWTATTGIQRSAEAAGLGFWSWTVNDDPGIRELLRRNIDGIITDHPDRAIDAREEMRDETGLAELLLDALDRFVTAV